MDLPSVEALLLEKEELESQMKKLEEGAVQVIMDKEKIILELQHLIHELQGQQSSNSDEEMHHKILLIEEHFSQQQREKDEEIQGLRQMVHDMHTRIEYEQAQFEDRIIRVEHETTERMLDTLNHQSNSAKEAETHLIQRLAESDEKLKLFERHIHEQESYIAQMKDIHHKEMADLEHKNIDSHRKLQAALQKIIKQEKQVEDVYKQMSLIKQERTSEILKVTKVRDEVLRNNIKMEKDVRRLQDHSQQVHKEHDQLEKEVKQLKDRLWIEQKLGQEKLVEQEKKFTITRQQLQSEIQRLSEDSHEIKGKDNLSSLGNSFIREEHDITSSDERKQQGQGGANLFAEISSSDFTDAAFTQENIFVFSPVSEQEHEPEEQQPQPPLISHQHQQDKVVTFSDVKQLAFFVSPKRQNNGANRFSADTFQSPPIVKIPINEMDNLREENESLRDLIIQLRKEIEYRLIFHRFREAKAITTSHESAIEALQNEFKNVCRNSGHDQCYQKEQALQKELQSFEKHSHKLEIHLMTSKQQWAEEKNFIQEELRYAESSLLESKTLLAQTTIEKEYFQTQLRIAQSQVKKQKTTKIAATAPSIKEMDYNAEQEHMEMVGRAMKKQEQQQQQDEAQHKKRKSILSFFR